MWDQESEKNWLEAAGRDARPYGRLHEEWVRQVLEGYLEALPKRRNWGWDPDIEELRTIALRRLAELDEEKAKVGSGGSPAGPSVLG